MQKKGEGELKNNRKSFPRMVTPSRRKRRTQKRKGRFACHASSSTQRQQGRGRRGGDIFVAGECKTLLGSPQGTSSAPTATKEKEVTSLCRKKREKKMSTPKKGGAFPLKPRKKEKKKEGPLTLQLGGGVSPNK